MIGIADVDYAPKKRLFKFSRRHFCPTEGRSWLYGLRMAFLEFEMAILETYTKNCKVHLRGVLQGICNFKGRIIRTLFASAAMKANIVAAEAKNPAMKSNIAGLKSERHALMSVRHAP
ncbi:MAG: hypothetical protein LBL74_00570 [Bacteroidales bacterium]|nr:hypothetical protein [Bacteroidales bacterium]